ncbi:MAG: hypothetical protein Kow00120_00400 [Anaerolineae bacterium]
MTRDARKCPFCDGRGYTLSRMAYIEQRCPVCRGEGGYRVRRKGQRLVLVPTPYPDGFARAQQRVARGGGSA